MSIHKFEKDDVLVNTVKYHPKHTFYIHDSKVFYRNQNKISGSFTENISGLPTGFIKVYDINIDRKQTITDRVIGKDHGNVFTTYNVYDTGMIYPWVYVDRSGYSFDQIDYEDYRDLGPGSIISASYEYSASVSRRFVEAGNLQNIQAYNLGIYGQYPMYQNQRREVLTYIKPQVSSSYLLALENTLKQYSLYSKHYISQTDQWDKRQQDINLISIPSIIFGSEIKKGSVVLKYYYSGSLIGELRDTGYNGELKQYSGSNSTNNGKVAGVVMYNHGFILLTGSWSLDNRSIYYTDTATSNSKWIYWGVGCNDGIASGSSTRLPVSYELVFEGTNKTIQHTYFATVGNSEANWSNNKTFLQFPNSTSEIEFPNYTPRTYRSGYNTIDNIVSSSVANHSASFSKTTYISRVNVYDKEGILIGVAKTSRPIRKTESNNYTFKLKLDI